MKTRIKKSFICSNVNDYQINQNLVKSHIPQVGDIAIFEVLSIGKHTTIQGDSKRNEKIIAGDQIMAAFGHRYATAQFEGYVPKKIQTEFHILGASGVIGEVKSTNDKFKDGGPTRLCIIGYVTNSENQIINTISLHESKMMKFTGNSAKQTKVILSIGSSMDSGKTTTAAYLVHNLKKQGKTVAFIKLTGTAYTKDADLAYDLGANMSIDFSKLGFPSTFMCSESELLNIYETLLDDTLLCEPDGNASLNYSLVRNLENALIPTGIYLTICLLLFCIFKFSNNSNFIFNGSASIAFILLVFSVRSILRRFLKVGIHWKNAELSIQKIMNLATNKTELSKLNFYEGHIAFNFVSFGYDDSTSVLNNLSFEASNNQITRICGKSCSGKTTVLRLITKLYSPNQGIIFIDGQDVNAVFGVRKHIGVVSEEFPFVGKDIFEAITEAKNEESKQKALKVLGKLSRTFQLKEAISIHKKMVNGGNNLSQTERKILRSCLS